MLHGLLAMAPVIKISVPDVDAVGALIDIQKTGLALQSAVVLGPHLDLHLLVAVIQLDDERALAVGRGTVPPHVVTQELLPLRRLRIGLQRRQEIAVANAALMGIPPHPRAPLACSLRRPISSSV